MQPIHLHLSLGGGGEERNIESRASSRARRNVQRVTPSTALSELLTRFTKFYNIVVDSPYQSHVSDYMESKMRNAHEKALGTLIAVYDIETILTQTHKKLEEAKAKLTSSMLWNPERTTHYKNKVDLYERKLQKVQSAYTEHQHHAEQATEELKNEMGKFSTTFLALGIITPEVYQATTAETLSPKTLLPPYHVTFLFDCAVQKRNDLPPSYKDSMLTSPPPYSSLSNASFDDIDYQPYDPDTAPSQPPSYNESQRQYKKTS